jgi:hypothetical protein
MAGAVRNTTSKSYLSKRFTKRFDRQDAREGREEIEKFQRTWRWKLKPLSSFLLAHLAYWRSEIRPFDAINSPSRGAARGVVGFALAVAARTGSMREHLPPIE